uniref:claudin-34-like n=1 Tax=Jaculus jaculus TaxID=51337 RepID=UPI001E1B408A|nr:claudin-34-like [Jaculus jaculus]
MIWLSKDVHLQMAGFLLATIAWILSSTSMGLVQWRVWYQDRPLRSYPSTAFVGMWRVCVYHHASNSSRAQWCLPYTYRDAWLPVDIRVSQHLLLAASILGLFAKALTIFALRNVHMGRLKKTACNPFVLSGSLNLLVSSCVLVPVLFSYHSITNFKETAFSSAFPVPFKPDTQKIGSALVVATVGAFLFFLSGIIFFSYPVPLDITVYPEDSK